MSYLVPRLIFLKTPKSHIDWECALGESRPALDHLWDYYWSLEPMKVSHDTENRFLPYRYPAYRMIPGFSQNPKNLSCSQKKLLPRRPSPQKTIRTYSSERQDETERNR